MAELHPRPKRHLLHRVRREFIRLWCRPNVQGLAGLRVDRRLCFVLAQPAPTDLALLDAELRRAGFTGAAYWVAVQRYVGWIIRRVVADPSPPALASLLSSTQARRTAQAPLPTDAPLPADASSDLVFVPVSIFWSRAPGRQGSWWRLWLSERWAASGRFRRTLMLLLNRRDILVQFGSPMAIAELFAADRLPKPNIPADDEATAIAPTSEKQRRDVRLLVRLFRTQLRAQRRAVLGPDLSHRRTLVNSILYAERVREAIREHAHGADAGRALAQRYTEIIASDMSYAVIRFFDLLLSWLWQRLYDGVEINGIERVEAIARSHALVYVPSHRSHMDYLLLSYVLHHKGLAIPHIAAGDNLNMPVLGELLRRAGAFFIRRSFRDDPLYAAVLNEYVWQMSSRGHSIEYFIEGGRTRTGRLLQPRPGLLAMTVAAGQRGADRPIAFVPIYFGYERVMEERSYLEQLRGGAKTRESWWDVFRVARQLRRHYGRVAVNFSQPLALETFLDRECADWRQLDLKSPSARALVPDLGRALLAEINRAAALNSRNLLSLVLLATPKGVMEATAVAHQVELFLSLSRATPNSLVTRTVSSGGEAIAAGLRARIIVRNSDAMGDLLSFAEDSRDIANWYRNNILHLFVTPSLITALVIAYGDRQRPWLIDRLAWLHPFFADDFQLPRPLPNAITAHWIDALIEQQVLIARDDLISAPPPMTEAHARASVLGRLVLPSIERYYTMISVLRGRPSGSMTPDAMASASMKVLERLERLYGFDSPEFLDAGLCRTFIDSLRRERWCDLDTHGRLTYDAKLTIAVREAAPVVRPDYRYALWQLRRAVFGEGTAFVDAIESE